MPRWRHDHIQNLPHIGSKKRAFLCLESEVLPGSHPPQSRTRQLPREDHPCFHRASDSQHLAHKRFPCRGGQHVSVEQHSNGISTFLHHRSTRRKALKGAASLTFAIPLIRSSSASAQEPVTITWF